MSVSQEDNESAPNLYIEFEDEDTPATAGPAELAVVGDREAIGVPPRGWGPRRGPAWTWAALSARGRKAVAAAVVLIGLGAAVGDALVAQAAQRAADRAAVQVTDASYTSALDGSGLDLLLSLADTGKSALTVTQARVQGPGLDLAYSGTPLGVGRSQQVEIVLSGQYDCRLAEAADGTLASPSTVRVTVRSIHGTVSTLDLPLPPSALLPGRWRDGRAGLCGWSY